MFLCSYFSGETSLRTEERLDEDKFIFLKIEKIRLSAGVLAQTVDGRCGSFEATLQTTVNEVVLVAVEKDGTRELWKALVECAKKPTLARQMNIILIQKNYLAGRMTTVTSANRLVSNSSTVSPFSF